MGHTVSPHSDGNSQSQPGNGESPALRQQQIRPRSEPPVCKERDNLCSDFIQSLRPVRQQMQHVLSLHPREIKRIDQILGL